MNSNVYLVDGVRTPFAKAGTDLKTVHAVELGRFALSELLARRNLSLEALSEIIDEVIIGNAGTPADAANVSRVVAMMAGLSQKISAYTVHRNCASGMESIAQAALKVEAGVGDVYIAGGTESMSQAPLIYNPKAVAFFERLSRAKAIPDRLKVLASIPIKEFLNPRIGIMEGLTDPTCGLNMGQTAEVLAKEFKITREEQDAYALRSHQRAVEAETTNRMEKEIAPYAIPPDFSRILTIDSGPRKNQTMEALAKLKPFFDRKYGSVTAGNACPITDGAGMTFIASEAGLKKLGNAKPLAKIRSYAFAGLDPRRMGLGPVYATHKALEKAGLKLKDMGVVEINEAFAAQVIACLKVFESKEESKKHLGVSDALGSIDPEILNPNGGAIALGHPVGATGTRIVMTAAYEMRRRKAKYGLATLCIGGGQGGAVILENLE
jgi:acetyl-CoA acyltransferase